MKCAQDRSADRREHTSHISSRKITHPHATQGGDVLFRSSERQQMIDWLIRSDIKDGGAGLDERTWLGRQITRRVPLHMSLRLDELHTSWITYWLHPTTAGSSSTLNAESPRQLLQGRWSEGYTFAVYCQATTGPHAPRPTL